MRSHGRIQTRHGRRSHCYNSSISTRFNSHGELLASTIGSKQRKAHGWGPGASSDGISEDNKIILKSLGTYKSNELRVRPRRSAAWKHEAREERNTLTRRTGVRVRRGCGSEHQDHQLHQLVYSIALLNLLRMSSRDGSILLAMSAFQLGQFGSIRAAAHAYIVPPTSLAKRLSGVTSIADSRPKNTRLTKSEEAVLIQEILKLDAQGYGP